MNKRASTAHKCAVTKKQFIVPVPIADELDRIAEQLGGKGNLKRIGAAGLLMFLHVSKADQRSYILWADAIALGSASLSVPPVIQPPAPAPGTTDRRKRRGKANA